MGKDDDDDDPEEGSGSQAGSQAGGSPFGSQAGSQKGSGQGSDKGSDQGSGKAKKEGSEKGSDKGSDEESDIDSDDSDAEERKKKREEERRLKKEAELMDKKAAERKSQFARQRSNLEEVVEEEEPEEEEEEEKTLVDHWLFNTIIMTGIVLNSLQMGAELQFTGEPFDTIYSILEHFFTAFFLLELCIKLPVMGPRAYFAEKANWLDTLVVIVAILDNWILPMVLTGDGADIGFISILRLVRLSRILKLLRSNRNLMMLIEGILSSIRAMFWLSILLGILIYTVSIVFVKFIGSEKEAYGDEMDVDKYFGSMLRASVTGMNLAMMMDFEKIFRPILMTQPLFALAILVYLGVSCFGIMNAIIGVIVTRTSQALAEAEAEDQLEFRNRQMEFVESIKDIIYEIDTDGDGTVSPEEIDQASDNEQLQEALSCCDLPAGFSMGELHCMLDKDGDGELTKGEFQQGMKRMIFSNDFQRQCLLSLGVAQTKRKLYQMKQDLADEFTNIHDKIDKLPLQVAQAMASAGGGMGGMGGMGGGFSDIGGFGALIPPATPGSVPSSDKEGKTSKPGTAPEGQIVKAEDAHIAGHVGDTAKISGLTNQAMLALSQKSHAQLGAKPPSLQQVLAEAGTVAGATAQISQSVFLEVSKALSMASHKWTQEDHNVAFPLAAINTAMGNLGGLRQAAQPMGNPMMQQGMMSNQFNRPMNQMPNQMGRPMPNQMNPQMMQQNQMGMNPMQNQMGGPQGNQWQNQQMPNQQQGPPGARQQWPAPGAAQGAPMDGSRPQTSQGGPVPGAPGAPGKGKGKGNGGGGHPNESVV